MKSIIPIIFATPFCFCVLLSCDRVAERSSHESEIMPVNVEVPVIDSVMLHKSYPGYISATNEVNIVARVSGYLHKTNFDGGQYVKKGQLLYIIEPKPYKEALTQAKAALSSAISQNFFAQNNYNSMKDAMANNAVSKIDFIHAQSTWTQSVAAIESAKAAVELAKLNLGYCYIKAPFSGHISKSFQNTGNFINAASVQTLATIYDDRFVNANFSIEDNQYLMMISKQAEYKCPDYKSVGISFSIPLPHSYVGYIDYLSPNVDLSTGTIALHARISNPYGEIKSGMYCTVSVPYLLLSKAILIKDAAISTDQLGKYIYIVNDSNKVVYTPIETGDLVSDSLRVVTKGILAGQKYVSLALQKVWNGMTVNPILSK